MAWRKRKDRGVPEPARGLPFQINPLPQPEVGIQPVPPRTAAPAPPAPPSSPAVPSVLPAPPASPSAQAAHSTKTDRQRRPPLIVATPIDQSPPSAEARHPATVPATLARFDPDALLAALVLAGATPGPIGRTATRCLAQPSDHSIWVTLGTAADAGLAATFGGTAVELRDGRMTRLAGSGPLPAAWPDDMKEVPLAWLAAELMPTGRPPDRPAEVLVVTRLRLAGPVIRRWHRSGATVSTARLRCEPLSGSPGQDNGEAMLIRIRSERGLPAAALSGLADLPGTVVCREAGTLLIDTRFQLPVTDRQMAAELPDDEHLIIGSADAGSWRITERGPEIVAAPHYSAPVPGPLPSGSTFTRPGSAALPRDLIERAEVRLVPAPTLNDRADAVLVDDGELPRLRRFLARSPLAETAFLFPGPGRHLLTEPGGLLTTVPFGVPVHRIGPQGLYVEAGYRLQPPVPAVARPEVFALDNESVVVCCTDGCWRLALASMLPCWSLWIGPAPEPTAGISAAAEQLLAGLAGDGSAGPAAGTAAAGWPGAVLDRSRLLAEAEQLEQLGSLSEAARRLEESGDLYRAGLLYERAARERTVER
jgi:hypothetical protein